MTMNRREFIKAVVASGCVAAIPVAVVGEATPVGLFKGELGQYDGVRFVRRNPVSEGGSLGKLHLNKDLMARRIICDGKITKVEYGKNYTGPRSKVGDIVGL